MAAYRDIPEDFAEHAREPARDLEMRYGAAPNTIARWRRELGIKVPPGARRGNKNHIGHGIDDSQRVQICLTCTAKRCAGQCKKVH